MEQDQTKLNGISNTHKINGFDETCFKGNINKNRDNFEHHLTTNTYEEDLKKPLNEENANTEEPNLKIELEMTEKRMIYNISDQPPLYLSFFFALQQSLVSIPKCLGIVAMISELICARDQEELKAKMFSTTIFVAGLCTVFQNILGVRLPVYQGPTSAYVIAVMTLETLPAWQCPDYWEYIGQKGNDYWEYIGQKGNNMTMNTNESISLLSEQYQAEYVLPKIRLGSLMLAGFIHMVFGLTGIVGFLMRFIGPLTVVPTLLLSCVRYIPVVVKFCETSWLVSSITVIICLTLSLFLDNRSMYIPLWNKKRGWHTIRYPLHKVLSMLFAIIIGWCISAILTATDFLSAEKGQPSFYARTDTRSHVVSIAPWFSIPYPGQFGPSSFSAGVFLCFITPTMLSIIDSIADYYACARTAFAPPPPQHAINRGIFIEGLFGIIAGAFGAGHATTTYGGNIGIIGMTKVASRSVFVIFGLQMAFTAILGKFGAFFVTIPYSVLGGTQVVGFGIFTGLLLANLSYVNMESTRNVSVVGIGFITGQMMPYWVLKHPEVFKTGNDETDGLIIMLMTNPNLFGGLVSCFLDNTLPGNLKDRGMIAWGCGEEMTDDDIPADKYEEKLTVYEIPFLTKFIKRLPFNDRIPIFPTYTRNR